MYLPVFLIIFLLVLLLLLANFRIHVELIAKDADITYTIKGTGTTKKSGQGR